MGMDEFVELVRRMRDEQLAEDRFCDRSEECLRLEKEVDRAIGLMDGKAWADSWREAAKEGA